MIHGPTKIYSPMSHENIRVDPKPHSIFAFDDEIGIGTVVGVMKMLVRHIGRCSRAIEEDDRVDCV